MHSYESKINNLKIENDRINGILKSRLGEIEDWKNKYNTIQQQITIYINVEKEKKNVEDKLNGYVRNIEELRFTNNKLESENSGLKKNENLIKDHERNNQNLNK